MTTISRTGNPQRSAEDRVVDVLDASMLDGSATDRHRFITSLTRACENSGTFYVVNHSVPASLCESVIEASRAFFDLPADAKSGIDIKRSEHFRGYSVMTNDRDWREQVHFGREQSPVDHGSATPDYYQLQGPNLWPQQLGETWRKTMLSYLDAVMKFGSQIANAVAEAAGLTDDYFDNLGNNSAYILMKLICYYPQVRNHRARNGVATHCDWSLLTVLLQSDAGLQTQSRNGEWIDVPPVSGALVINLGELIEITTSGRFRATPHRVINQSWDTPRISIPVFINPSLDATINPGRNQQASAERI